MDESLQQKPSMRTKSDSLRRFAPRSLLHNLNQKNIRRHSLSLEGMDCSDCALVVEHRLSRLEGVLEVQVDFNGQSVQVAYDTSRISQRAIEKRVRQLGYDLVPGRFGGWYRQQRELILALAGGFLALLAWLGERYAAQVSLGLSSAQPTFSLALYWLAFLLTGLDVTRHALQGLRQRRFDTDLLMVAAALGAASLGDYAEGALLLFLFSLGHALEERALDRARRAMRALGKLVPKFALVRRDGQEQLVPVEQLVLGEEVLVRPGERLPVDGQVISGRSAVDQSPITGESLPVEKSPGDPAYAGSVNGEGVLGLRVTRLAKDSTLARVMQMVERAQASKAPTQQLVERFTRIYVPLVLLGVLLLIILPPIFGKPFAESFRRAMTLLVATSPCALALGTPSAALAGIAQAARNGVLVKGGAHLENMGRIQVLAFDKTATLTTGELCVVQVTPLGALSSRDVVALAGAVERQSAHPLAKAVLRAAQDDGLPLPTVNQVQAHTGLGIQARLDEEVVRVGSLKWFDELGLQVTSETRSLIAQAESRGQSVSLVGIEEQPIGLIFVADTLRPGAEQTLVVLERLGVQRMIMLSGDNPRAAAHIAGQLGLREFRAGLLPEDKLAVVDELMEAHIAVGMVGDGVNDAPALARATVGIAMGGAGTDVALETADVALMGSDLQKLPFAIGLGRATQRVIRQNLFIALGVMVGLVFLALSGLAGIGPAILFHEGSTLLVVGNALRLLRYAS